jgi:hypothetical protein
VAILAPLLAGAIGAGVIGEAIIGLGLSLGASYLARRLQPEPDTTQRSMTLSLRVEANESREIAFGRVASAGSLVYHNTYGPNGNDYLQLVIQLADHECDALEKVIIDGVDATLGSSVSTTWVSGQPVNQYPSAMWIKFYDGDWDQTADADLVARAPSSDPWPSTNRGRGVCYVRITMKFDAEIYQGGIPNFRFVFRGAKLYDPRKDTTAGGSGSHRWGTESTYQWSDNPAVIAYNWMRGFRVNGTLLGGMNVPAGSLPYDTWAAAANVCDENVSLLAGGTEKRYRAHRVFPVAIDNRSVIREMISACAGQMADSGGVFTFWPGASRSSVITITDADLMGDQPVEYTPKLSRSELVNQVFATYSEPLSNYEPTPAAPRISPSDQADDGGAILSEHYNLTAVTSQTQAQRVSEILRRRARYQRRLSIVCRSRLAVVEAGDWVTVTSSRLGFTDVTFEVQRATLGRDLTVALELAEVSTAIYTWTPATDELNPNNPKKVGRGAATTSAVSGFALARVLINAGSGGSRPGLAATWSTITDRSTTDVEIEFRRVGDTVAQTVVSKTPFTNSYTWTAGVQGNTRYEARARMLSAPARSNDWTAWTATSLDTAPFKVDLAVRSDTAALAEGLTLNALDSLNVVIEDQVAAALGADLQIAAYAQEAVAKYAGNWGVAVTDDGEVTGVVSLSGTDGVPVLYNVRTTSGSTTATMASTKGIKANATITGNAAIPPGTKVSSVSPNGTTFTLSAAATATATANPTVFRLPGEPGTSRFVVVASEFLVAQPGATGGTAKPVFAIRKVDGVNTLALAGDIIADGSILTKHLEVGVLSALFAALGDVTVQGTMRSQPTVYSRNVASTAGSSTATMNTTAGVKIGDVFRNHPKIVDGTTITAILGPTTVRMNRLPTGSNSAVATRMESPGKLFMDFRTGRIRALA